MAGIRDKWWVNAALVVVSAAITLILAELIIRVTSAQRPGSWLKDMNIMRGYFKADEELGYDINNENYMKDFKFHVDNVSFPVWSNELGCFDDPYGGEEGYILLVGDSVAWGWVPFEHTWGTTIEKITSKRVLKCGITGFETRGELLKAKKVIKAIRKTPSLIIVGYCIDNDLNDRWLYPRRTVIDGYLVDQAVILNAFTGEKDRKNIEDLKKQVKEYSSKSFKGFKMWPAENKEYSSRSFKGFKIWLAKNSVLYNKAKGVGMLRKIAIKLGIAKPLNEPLVSSLSSLSPEKYTWLKEAWNIHLFDIKSFKSYADSIQARLLIVLVPLKPRVYDFLKVENPDIDYELPHKILGEFLTKNGISYLDLTPFLRSFADQRHRKSLDDKKDFYYQYDSHWNVKGNRLAGLVVSKYILEKEMINLNDKKETLTNIEKQLRSIREN